MRSVGASQEGGCDDGGGYRACEEAASRAATDITSVVGCRAGLSRGGSVVETAADGLQTYVSCTMFDDRAAAIGPQVREGGATGAGSWGRPSADLVVCHGGDAGIVCLIVMTCARHKHMHRRSCARRAP